MMLSNESMKTCDLVESRIKSAETTFLLFERLLHQSCLHHRMDDVAPADFLAGCRNKSGSFAVYEFEFVLRIDSPATVLSGLSQEGTIRRTRKRL